MSSLSDVLIVTSSPIFTTPKATIPYHLRCLSRQASWVFSTCVASPFNSGKYNEINVVFEDTNVRSPYTDQVKAEIEKMVGRYIERNSERA